MFTPDKVEWVESVEDLDALPPFSAIIDGYGYVWQKAVHTVGNLWRGVYYNQPVEPEWLMERSARYRVIYKLEATCQSSKC